MLDLRHHQSRAASATREVGSQWRLAWLYERFDAVATGRAPADGVDFHQLILDRLTANQTRAQAAGWTACAFERDGGSGRLRLIGVAPSARERSIVPDWTAGVAADALAASGATHATGPHLVRDE